MRILGIDPHSKGIGFAVLERDNKLVDWGVKHLPTPKITTCSRSNQKDRNYQRIVENLLDFYEPDSVVCDDWTAKQSRRSERLKNVLHQISIIATKRGIASHSYARIRLNLYFAEYDVKTKYEIACFLTKLFPELLPKLPKKRRAWDGEDVRTHIFMALAFCLLRAEKP
jgi:Holliday junction resolvasome RuvABC endonuclease subunit